MQSKDRLARAASAIALATILQACVSVPDVPIPAGYATLVDSARADLLDNFEGLVKPSLAVTRLRCFANGGLVILFRQVGGPTSGEPAFAMGGGPGAVPDVWSGGYGDMASIDGEIQFNFGSVPEVVCPPR